MRRTFKLFLAAAISVAAVVVPAQAASSQTGYPPPPCNVTSSSTELGTFNVGDTFDITFAAVCSWEVGTQVSVGVNSQANVLTKTVGANGQVSFTVQIVSANTLAINPDVPIVCGRNSITVTGFSSAANANVSQTAFFTNSCAAAPTKAGGVAFTGSDLFLPSAVALAAVVGGSILMVVSRRRRATV